MAAWLLEVDEAYRLDLVIANAGTSGLEKGEDDPTRVIFKANLDGLLKTLEPIIPRMLERGRGHLALMSSLAAFRGFPTAPAYAASKAAVKNDGEGQRPLYRRRGLAVSVICPGFVRTPMTAVNTAPMPFILESDQAAAIIR